MVAEQGEGHASPSPAAAGGGGIIYTEDDIRHFIASQDCTFEDFKHRWIIQHITAYYVFVNGVYKYPVPKDALMTKLRDDLAPAEPLGIRLWTTKSDGEIRKMVVQEIMDTYGTVARQTRGSLTLDRSYYDPESEIFWEALCPPRNVNAVFHDQIDTWLRLLGNTQAELLLDWIATIGQLEDQTSALYPQRQGRRRQDSLVARPRALVDRRRTYGAWRRRRRSFQQRHRTLPRSCSATKT